MESHFHQTHRRIIVLMEFQCHLIFARRTLRYILQWNLKAGFPFGIHAQHSPIKMDCTPIPTAQRQLLLKHIFAIVFLKEVGQFGFFARFEADESMQCAGFREQTYTERVDHFLEIDDFNVAAVHLIDFAGFIVFENDILVG